MRTTRVDKFRRSRYNRAKKIILLGIIVPFTSIIIGYLITAVFILPVMSR